jgi:divinyl chlorophyllide a 8-vinyl-reductase
MVSVATARRSVVITGATGYIGKSVVLEAVRRGYRTMALVRDVDKCKESSDYQKYFAGAELIECDVCNQGQLTQKLQEITDKSGRIDAIVSCLASRSGVKKDSYKIDYQASHNCLEAGRSVGARHYVMLSAFCVAKPLLHFQHAKLKMEAALQAQTDMTWSIVRPTAFFKSVSSQMERVRGGGAFMIFQGGADTSCNPIAESDLASYLLNCVTNNSLKSKILNVGGPDNAITKRRQGEMMFEALGTEPKFSKGPSVRVLSTIRRVAEFSSKVTRLTKLADAAEVANILSYYITQDMLTTQPFEKFGRIRLQDHYNRIAKEGSEYDPYVSLMVKEIKPPKGVKVSSK